MEIRKFEGIVAAPFTPFHIDGSLNLNLIPEYYDFLKKNGIRGIFMNGTTGEGPSLTRKEKQEQALAWSGCLRPEDDFRIINMIGGTSYLECIEIAKFSKEIGLHAVAIVAPYYYKVPDESYLAEFIIKIGQSVPELPVYYYHIPMYTGVGFPILTLLEKLDGMLENFAGIKYTSDNYFDFNQCLNFRNFKYDLLWGFDESFLSAMRLGARGAVGSTYNYAAPLYLEMIEAFNQGEMEKANRLQEKSARMVAVLEKYGGLGAGKFYMKYIGFDFGKFRSPVKNPPDDIYPAFAREVELLDMDEYFSKK